MPLIDTYINVYGQLPRVFKKIAEGQAPPKFTVQYLKDLGFPSTNYRSVVPLLKGLGFLSPEGVPTSRYHDYRNQSLSRRVMAQVLREAYSDLFTIKSNPTNADRVLIEGKFKSAHNTTDQLAKLKANTFFSLLGLADLTDVPARVEEKPKPAQIEERIKPERKVELENSQTPTLHYKDLKQCGSWVRARAIKIAPQIAIFFVILLIGCSHSKDKA